MLEIKCINVYDENKITIWTTKNQIKIFTKKFDFIFNIKNNKQKTLNNFFMHDIRYNLIYFIKFLNYNINNYFYYDNLKTKCTKNIDNFYLEFNYNNNNFIYIPINKIKSYIKNNKIKSIV